MIQINVSSAGIVQVNGNVVPLWNVSDPSRPKFMPQDSRLNSRKIGDIEFRHNYIDIGGLLKLDVTAPDDAGGPALQIDSRYQFEENGKRYLRVRIASQTYGKIEIE